MRFLASVIAAIVLSIAAVEAAPNARVVSIGGDVTEIVYALGQESRLVGVDETSLYPASTKSLPHVGYLRNL